MPRLHVLRVFAAPDGSHGNALGVFLEGHEVPGEARQSVAHDLGFAETVFIDDAERAELRIFTPDTELPFAGHPLVGTAWLLREEGRDATVLRPPAGEVPVRFEAELAFIAGRPEWAPAFDYIEMSSPQDVNALSGAPAGQGWAYCWAWENEEGGVVRARSFVPEAGIPEDEATGAAALVLCSRIGRPIEVRQGQGSDIIARPVEDGFVEVGGRVLADEVRDYPTVESR